MCQLFTNYNGRWYYSQSQERVARTYYDTHRFLIRFKKYLPNSSMGYIYKIRNKINGKCYIGQTKRKKVNKRWSEHKRKDYKKCTALHSAFEKYGRENFEFSIIIICFDEDRFKYEKYYIKKMNTLSPNGYNLTTGGEDGSWSDEMRANFMKSAVYPPERTTPMLKALAERWVLPEYEEWRTEMRKTYSIIHTGKKLTEEHKKNVGKALLGRIVNDTTREKISDKHSVKVNQYTIQGEYKKTWKSGTQAGSELNINHISEVCNGLLETSGGFVWRFYKDFPNKENITIEKK